MSDRMSSIRILDDAKRLNMMDGHFVWLWIDTAAIINVRNNTDEVGDNELSKLSEHEEPRFKRDVKSNAEYEQFIKRRRAILNDMEEANINYLLQNDQYLLFNRNSYSVESSKLKNSRSDRRKQQKKDDSESSGGSNSIQAELPAGLLSLKPLPIRVDRHLVKGAVRLLVSVLKDVLNRSPSWVIRKSVTLQSNGCWKNTVVKDRTFTKSLGK